MPSRWNGYAITLGGAALFGTLGLFSKLYYDEGGEPYDLLFLRFVGTGSILLAVVLVLREPLPAPRIAAVTAVGLGAGQFGVAYALFEGFERAPIALVVLVFYVYPLLVTVGAAALYGEPFGAPQAAMLAAGLAGVAMIVGMPEEFSWLGVALGLAGGACVTGVILASRRLMASGEITPLWLGALMFAGPGAALLLAVPLRAPTFDATDEGALWAVCAVVVSAAIPITFFYTGVKLVGASTASLLALAEPLVAVVLAYAVLDETLGPLQLVGGALIVGAVAALSVQGVVAARRPAHAG